MHWALIAWVEKSFDSACNAFWGVLVLISSTSTKFWGHLCVLKIQWPSPHIIYIFLILCLWLMSYWFLAVFKKFLISSQLWENLQLNRRWCGNSFCNSKRQGWYLGFLQFQSFPNDVSLRLFSVSSARIHASLLLHCHVYVCLSLYELWVWVAWFSYRNFMDMTRLVFIFFSIKRLPAFK